MNGGRAKLTALMLATVSVVAGCSNQPAEEEGVTMSLSWQEAKAEAQSMEIQIVSVLPEDSVEAVEQKTEGILLSCSKGEHNWNGATTVTLGPGADPETLIRFIEDEYRESSYQIRTRLNIVGQYEVQLFAAGTAESYIIAEDAPGTIRIASGSRCFMLPDDVYPGGLF